MRGEQLERGRVDVEAGLQGGGDQPTGCPRPRHQGWLSSPRLRIRIDLMRIRIQHYFLNCGSGSSSGSKVLETKNLKKY